MSHVTTGTYVIDLFAGLGLILSTNYVGRFLVYLFTQVHMEGPLYRNVKTVPDKPVVMTRRKIKRYMRSDYAMGKKIVKELKINSQYSAKEVFYTLAKAYNIVPKVTGGKEHELGYTLTVDAEGNPRIEIVIPREEQLGSGWTGYFALLVVYYILFDPEKDVTLRKRKWDVKKDQYFRICAYIAGVIKASKIDPWEDLGIVLGRNVTSCFASLR